MNATVIVRKPTHIAAAGWGYDYYPQNFGRLREDTPVSVARDEHAKPHHLIVYRISDGLRMHVDYRCLTEVQS